MATKGYIALPGGFSYCILDVGMTVRAPNGKEVYCQPGDDTAAMLSNIEALEEACEENKTDEKFCVALVDMALSDYF